jgi:two-component system phosphate regulon sensor histidine kinase PhoR
MKLYFDLRSLSVQMILSFVGVVILTSAAVGLPAIWLIRDQLDRQAWSQVDQGRRAALALYEAKQNEVESLAILTAQRPTLRDLLLQENDGVLEDYLETLKTVVGLDLVVVCDPTSNTYVSTDTSIPMEICDSWSSGGFQILPTGTHPQVWFVATHPVERDGNNEGKVIVGITLDDDIATQMRDQTGLEHSVWVIGQPVSTSLNTEITQLETLSRQGFSPDATEEIIYSNFELAGQPYYSALSQLDATGIEVEVILSVAEIAAIQTRMVWIMIGSMLIVAVMGSVIGVILARRISKPLVHLADTAEEFRKGDLSSSVAVDSQIREITQVSQTLESARIDLQRTLTNLEREKAWVNQLLESIVEGIMTLDHDEHITYFSPGAERLTGWSREDVLGNAVDHIFRLPDTEASFSQSIAVVGSRSKLVVELADGHQATLAITKARLAPSEVGDSQTVLVFRDVSEGEIIHRILGNFLANITHEFRTPLSAAAASIELLIDQAPDLSDAELQELLNSLHLGILGLQTLVDNLLETASIEAGRFRISPHPSDLAEIISKAVQTMQPLLEKYGQRLVVELPTDIPVVNADARRVEQVLVNLLSNASKYGPADAEISISAMVDQEWVKVQVTDRGPGITHEQRKYVFRRFMYPGILNDRAKAGAGLGLSVVKAVVEAHGGQVGVDDRPGGGSIFWFTLPMMDE